jgi:hypothetical protein
MISQLDFFTPGWMGANGDNFDQGYVCEEGKQGAVLGNLVPVVVSYIAAGYVKRHHDLCDGNVSGCSGGDLGKASRSRWRTGRPSHEACASP